MTEGVSGLSNAAVVGIGTDLVDVDRFRTVLRRRPSVAVRLFTAGERTYAERAIDPAARLAARFAAKEATLKALGYGLGGMRMADIEITRADDGRPELVLHGDARSTAAVHGVGRWLVSLSHTDHLAQATVVALGT
ncbi:MAG: holo-ACP synthase [Acidimicrobiaceae bacterium]|nr:holo-ACP synthase [Acidimicrobiaceae bacterium]